MKSSLKHYGMIRKIFTSLFTILILGCFFSCSKKVTSSSITSTFDEVDRYISQGQTSDALRLLKKTDKKSFSVNVRLGIYKRYLILGENSLAEKVIKSCYKKNKSNREITAVYAQFLLKDGKLKDALEISKNLSGTSYGSIYAEAMLRNELQKENVSITFDDFCTSDYSSVYYDAYIGSQDSKWLRNCAVINLISGKVSGAASLVPKQFDDVFDAYFWSVIFYDNKQFVEASEYLKQAKDLAQSLNNDIFYTKQNGKVSQSLELKIRALLADSYINLSEEKLAEAERNSLLAYLTSLDDENLDADPESVVDATSAGHPDILSVIYLNSALWALSRGEQQGAYRLLNFEVEKWPDYIPGLIAYGNFAYNSNLLQLDDPMTQELRKLGIQSMDMKAFDDLPRIPVEDAIARMEDSLARFKNFELYVAKLDLEDKIRKYSEKSHLAKIYNTLERNTLATNFYPPEITRYAVHGLIYHQQLEEAEDIFFKYIAARYNFDSKRDFFDEFFTNMNQMETWEIEYAAWFQMLHSKSSLSSQLLELIVYNEYLKETKNVKEISLRATSPSMLNLAMIYSSTGRKDEALKLYGAVSGRARDVESKAEALYRIGVIYSDRNEIDDALKSLRYAIYLNPAHSKARLLLSKIKR